MTESLVINKSALIEAGVSITSFLFMLILSSQDHVKTDLNLTQIIEYEFIIADEDGYSLTKDGERFIKFIVGDPESKKKAIKVSEELVDALREMFPEGKKAGTNKYWRDNKVNIARKMNTFYRMFGYHDDEVVLKATKKYIDSFGANNQLQRVLPYFILKNDESELMTIIENIDEVKSDSNNDLWGSVLC